MTNVNFSSLIFLWSSLSLTALGVKREEKRMKGKRGDREGEGRRREGEERRKKDGEEEGRDSFEF
jgi:hypothetical protein